MDVREEETGRQHMDAREGVEANVEGPITLVENEVEMRLAALEVLTLTPNPTLTLTPVLVVAVTLISNSNSNPDWCLYRLG